jgi:hypothetical protein
VSEQEVCGSVEAQDDTGLLDGGGPGERFGESATLHQGVDVPRDCEAGGGGCDLVQRVVIAQHCERLIRTGVVLLRGEGIHQAQEGHSRRKQSQILTCPGE